jgi:hypothetical protein
MKWSSGFYACDRPFEYSQQRTSCTAKDKLVTETSHSTKAFKVTLWLWEDQLIIRTLPCSLSAPKIPKTYFSLSVLKNIPRNRFCYEGSSMNVSRTSKLCNSNLRLLSLWRQTLIRLSIICEWNQSTCSVILAWTRPFIPEPKLHTQGTSVFFFLDSSWGGVRLNPLGTSATLWPIVPAPDDYECGTVCGMRLGRGNWSTLRKPTPVPFCPPQIPHDLTWARNRADAVGIRWLTAWAMARPTFG